MKDKRIIEILKEIIWILKEQSAYTGFSSLPELEKELASLESETEVKELEPDEMSKEGIKYLQEKYPDKEILKLPNLDELGEFTDFVMGMQIGHALAQSQPEVWDACNNWMPDKKTTGTTCVLCGRDRWQHPL